MHCKWMTNDMKPLNEFIHLGNMLKMDFTEKESSVVTSHSEFMNWLSDYWQKKRIKFFRRNIFAKQLDVINSDGEIAHIPQNASEQELHEYRQTQLNAILSILAEYKSNNTIRWANIRSWISLVIAILSFLFSLVTCK